MIAIEKALRKMQKSNVIKGEYDIFSDFPMYNKYRHSECAHYINRKNYKIVFIWVPSHIGIKGNIEPDNCKYPHISQESWDNIRRQTVNKKRREIKRTQKRGNNWCPGDISEAEHWEEDSNTNAFSKTTPLLSSIPGINNKL